MKADAPEASGKEPEAPSQVLAWINTDIVRANGAVWLSSKKRREAFPVLVARVEKGELQFRNYDGATHFPAESDAQLAECVRSRLHKLINTRTFLRSQIQYQTRGLLSRAGLGQSDEWGNTAFAEAALDKASAIITLLEYMQELEELCPASSP